MTLITEEAKKGKKFDVKKYYNLPEKVIYCSKCVVSNQRPRITFDKDNVCSACRFAEYKNTKIDWDERERELKDLLDKKFQVSFQIIIFLVKK